MISWLERFGQFAIFLVPFFAFAEACFGIGLFVSGAFLVLVSTLLLASGLAPIAVIIPLALLGALAGDHAGFYLGRWLGPRFHETAMAIKYRDSIGRAEALIKRYGALAIFIGRFVPAIRSLIPALIGISGFARSRYLLLDFIACLLWSLALGGILLTINAL